MSAVEIAVEKVKLLDEAHAQRLLAWLEAQGNSPKSVPHNGGAAAMLGFARRFRLQARSTASWMTELRDGEQ